MRTFSVGAISRSRPSRGSQSGVTLLELLIVATLIALVVGLSYPSAAAGVDSLRIRSAADRVVSFLNTALDRAERRQQVVEIRISTAENAISARTADAGFDRTMEIPDPIHITAIEPPLVNGSNPDRRSFLVYPGGTAPRITIELASKDGRRRRVVVDPVTGTPRSEAEAQVQ
jgi:prepilin-type N-terminal cleavage/methylation domain-containing protein